MKSHIAGLTKRFGYFGATKYHAPAAKSGKQQNLSLNYCLIRNQNLLIAGKMLIPKLRDSTTILLKK
ncbi:hypothetical protein CA265_07470 [Sphingobacteriaceae bacterium GW460-11-11-14-LB5]|nr:hypothetical protein CA265_07470 [Sphingobacteriaceae bacterium GW460-11-11-14-LB5]